MWHYPASDIMNGSLLTVESNHFCVLKSRGAAKSVVKAQGVALSRELAELVYDGAERLRRTGGRLRLSR